MLGGFQQQEVDGSEASPALSLSNQAVEESFPLFDIWAVTIQGQVKRTLDGKFEQGASPFAENSVTMNLFRVLSTP